MTLDGDVAIQPKPGWYQDDDFELSNSMRNATCASVIMSTFSRNTSKQELIGMNELNGQDHPTTRKHDGDPKERGNERIPGEDLEYKGGLGPRSD